MCNETTQNKRSQLQSYLTIKEEEHPRQTHL